MQEITYEELHEKFIYLSTEGVLINIKTKKTVESLDKLGYSRVTINKKSYLVHRIVYFMYYGYLPENDIDHINRNPSDNRISNLREVSRACNLKNIGNPCLNTSSVKGISWHKNRNRWIVYIRHKKKKVHVGTFKNFINAVKARYYAEQKFNYHLCDFESPAAKYLNNLKNLINLKFESNVKIEKSIGKDTVESEWNLFCYTHKKKIDQLAEI